jgi:PAS domain S-box-containing protein
MGLCASVREDWREKSLALPVRQKSKRSPQPKAIASKDMSSCASPMVPNTTMLKASTSRPEPEQNGTKEVTMMTGESRVEHSWIDTLSVPVFVMDLSKFVTGWNIKTAETTRIPAQDILNRPLGSVVHIDSADRLEMAVKAIENGGDSSVCDLTFSNCGHLCHMHIKLSAQLDSKGQTSAIVCFAETSKSPINDPPITPVPRPSIENDGSDAQQINHSKIQTDDSFMELASLIEIAHAPIFGVNRSGEIDLWNYMSAETLGFSKDLVLGKSLVEFFIGPASRQSAQAVVDQALAGNSTANYELEIETKAGQVRYLLANVSSRPNSSGDVIGVVVFAQDVTESAQNDRAVAAMARELRQLLDTANTPIFGVDTAGLVNEWNDRTSEVTGFSGDEAFNKPLVETFIVPDLQPSVQEILDNALRGRGTSNIELEIRTKDNETRYLLVNATTRRDAESNIVGVVCIAQDVTEAIKHDRAVAAMANELRQLIDTANAPIFGIDRDG